MSIQLHSIKGYKSFSKIYNVGMKFRSGNASAVIIFSEDTLKQIRNYSGKVQKTCSAEFVTVYPEALEVAKKNIDNSGDEMRDDEIKHTIYYGVTISKKIAKKAVVRNRIKRLLRESLRIVSKESEIKKMLPIKKIIISYFAAPKHPMQINLNDILPTVKNLLEQAYCKTIKN